MIGYAESYRSVDAADGVVDVARKLGLVTAGVAAALALSGCASASTRREPPAPSVRALAVAQEQLGDLLNTFRADQGLPLIKRDAELDAVAEAWSLHLAETGDLAHNPAYAQLIPTGWSTSGENVGWLDPAERPLSELPQALHEAWLDSPTHRANMTNAAYTAVGLGIAYDPEHGYYVTEDFAEYP